MILGYEFELLSPQTCDDVLRWVTSGASNPWPQAETNDWLLAHCDDGVVWGYRDSQRAWRLSSAVRFPSVDRAVSPPLRSEALQQLRTFGAAGELLLWRADAGFQGRWLKDRADSALEEHLAPIDEGYCLLGDRLLDEPEQGFSLVGDATGARQAVPLLCSREEFGLPGRGAGTAPSALPLDLLARHYLEQDDQTGVVRIAASRLVAVRNRSREEVLNAPET